MFYTSEEDWIEDIEITLFTKTMAFIAKQRYDDEVNPIEKFDGIRMVKVKSKVDYICDSLVPVNWDDLEGVELAVDRNYSKDEDKNISEKVTDFHDIGNALNKNTNGEVNEKY